jgi:multiple antibiotic resistance protein
MNVEGLAAFALLCLSSLFAITNPLNTAPLYLALTDGYTPEHQLKTLRTAIITAAIILVVFALLGGAIFAMFGITIDAFRIAGGILLFQIGTDMLQAKRSRVKTTPEEEQEAMVKDDVAITPLGIPLIVGPGAITTVMVLMSNASTTLHAAVVFASIAIVLGSIYAVLSAGPRIVKVFGKTGLNVMTRIMGLLLTVIAVQFIVNGARPILTEIMRAAGTG